MFIEVTSTGGNKRFINCKHIVEVTPIGADTQGSQNEGTRILLSVMMSVPSGGERYLTNKYEAIAESYDVIKAMIIEATR